MSAMQLDPYATLGIPPGATRAEAARAHRRLAKQHHPDVNRGSEAAERMRRINAAWRILSDPARRARYDADRTARPAATHWAGAGRRARSTTGYGYGPGYGPREYTAGWASWPEERRAAAARARRAASAPPVEPSFGDRPAVVIAVCVGLGLLYFVGAWLGSIGP